MDRATYLTDTLGLTHHPEGGHYREVFRSSTSVTAQDGRGERSAATTIFFLLAGGDHSSWHVVRSDEVWHYYEGDPLELVTIDPATWAPRVHRLGPLGDDQSPVRVVPAGHWQAARPLGAYTLVGCTVAPGFEFADFELLRDNPEAEGRLLSTSPDLATLL